MSRLNAREEVEYLLWIWLGRVVINADKNSLKNVGSLRAHHLIGNEVPYATPRPLQDAFAHRLAKREEDGNHCVNYGVVIHCNFPNGETVTRYMTG